MKYYKELSIILFISIFSTSSISQASAWSHGYESYPYATFPIDYQYSRNYGVTDWIAENVFRTLYANDTFQWQWLEALELMYYIGTESIANPEVHMRIDGEEVQGNNYRDNFRVTVSVVNNTFDYGIPLLSDIQDAFDNFKRTLINESFYLSAYYMGRFVAYISLLGYYPIFVENGNLYRQYEWYYNAELDKTISHIDKDTCYLINNTSFENVSVSEASDRIIENNLLSTHTISNESITLKLDWLNASKPYPDAMSRDEWITKDNSSNDYLFYNFHEMLFNDIVHYASSLCKMFVDEIAFEGVIIDDVQYNFKGLDERTVIVVVSIAISTFFIAFIYLFRTKIKETVVNREHFHFNGVKKVKKRNLRRK